MKRLTTHEIIAGQVHDIPVFEMQDCAGVEEIIKRLAAYEDTGLEPEEIVKIREDIENGYMKSTARRYGVPVDRLRELAEADREGRCVVLPRLEPGRGDPVGELGEPGEPGIAD